MYHIDAHQHFWEYHPNRHQWMDESMMVIKKNFLPSDLAPILVQNQMDACIAIQADQSVSETDFLVSLAHENLFIKGVVGWVDLLADDLPDQLSKYQETPILKGFRHILQAEDPAFMLHPKFQSGIGWLAEFGFTFDLLVYPRHLAAVSELVENFPAMKFIIDHMAKPTIKKGLIDEWGKAMREISQYENVFVKVSGLITEADWTHWNTKDLIPYLDLVTDAFGTKRMVYGSDWPVCLLAGEYPNMLAPIKAYFQNFSEAEQAAIFGLNAQSFYHLT